MHWYAAVYQKHESKCGQVDKVLLERVVCLALLWVCAPDDCWFAPSDIATCI